MNEIYVDWRKRKYFLMNKMFKLKPTPLKFFSDYVSFIPLNHSAYLHSSFIHLFFLVINKIIIQA